MKRRRSNISDSPTLQFSCSSAQHSGNGRARGVMSNQLFAVLILVDILHKLGTPPALSKMLQGNERKKADD